MICPICCKSLQREDKDNERLKDNYVCTNCGVRIVITSYRR